MNWEKVVHEAMLEVIEDEIRVLDRKTMMQQPEAPILRLVLMGAESGDIVLGFGDMATVRWFAELDIPAAVTMKQGNEVFRRYRGRKLDRLLKAELAIKVRELVKGWAPGMQVVVEWEQR